MHLGGIEGAALLLDVSCADPQELVGLVDGTVEQYVVVRHIEMAVVVDPSGVDPHNRRDERRKEHGFEIAAIEHGASSGSARRGGTFAAPRRILISQGRRSKRGSK